MYLILSKEKYAQCNTLLFTFKEQTEGRKGGKRKNALQFVFMAVWFPKYNLAFFPDNHLKIYP
jgi:hypothetical protein